MNAIRTIQWWIWVLLMTMAALLVFATSVSSSGDRLDEGMLTPGILAGP